MEVQLIHSLIIKSFLRMNEELGNCIRKTNLHLRGRKLFP